jgi:hypothetical protein
MTEQRNRNEWRDKAIELGVDPDEIDDYRYWTQLDRATGIIDSFRYHQPSAEQIERIAEVRQAHIACAKVILRSSSVSADQTAALRQLHESMMTANKGIVNEK